MQDIESFLQIATQPAALGIACFYLLRKLQEWDKRRDVELLRREQETSAREAELAKVISDGLEWQRTILLDALEKSSLAIQASVVAAESMTAAVNRMVETVNGLPCNGCSLHTPVDLSEVTKLKGE